MPRKPMAVIIAGGSAKRMEGKEKPLQLLAGKPLLQHVIDGVRESVEGLIINSNSHFPDYKEYGYPVVEDLKLGAQSPLIGVYSGLHWYNEQKAGIDYMVTLPADVPVFPQDLVLRLKQAAEQSESGIAYIECEGQQQPLFAIWPLGALKKLRAEIAAGNLGSKYVLQKLNAQPVAMSKSSPEEFTNINTLAELATLEAQLAQNNTA